MILPDDDSIELPDDDSDFVVDESDPPMKSTDDGLALLPGYARRVIGPPGVAVLEALGAIANKLWARSSIAIGQQQSPRFADAEWLNWWGELFHRPRAPGESDADYRARLMIPLKTITPNAIRGVLNALVAGAGFAPNAQPVVEEVDGAAYLAPAYDVNSQGQMVPESTLHQSVIAPTVAPADVCAWAAFVQPSATAALNKSIVADRVVRLWAIYPDRPDGGKGCGGYLWPNIGVGNSIGPTAGPLIFFVIVAGASDLSDTAPTLHVLDQSADVPNEDADFLVGIDGEVTQHQLVVQPMYKPDGAQTSNALIVYGGYLSAAGDSLGEVIIREIERRRAAGVGWVLLVDPLLHTAL